MEGEEREALKRRDRRSGEEKRDTLWTEKIKEGRKRRRNKKER